MIAVKNCRLEAGNVMACSGEVVVRGERGVYSLAVEGELELYVFETPLRKKIACSGQQFQTHVWGSARYTLWLLRKGENKCVALDDVHVHSIGEDIYVISRSASLEQLSEDLTSALAVIKHVNTRGSVVILFSDELGLSLFFENLVSTRSADRVREHTLDLLSRAGGKPL